MQKQLDHTSKSLASATEELKQAKYALTEKDYIILQQRKAEAVQNVVRLHKAGSTAGLEEMSSMISANCCSFDQVDVRLATLEVAALENKETVEKLTSMLDVVNSDAKRKWEEFYKQAEHDFTDGSNFSAAKHCRMELELQQWLVLSACSLL
ncbi:hypothetical protein B296_00001651 [Ensete ventricosum]|uniref:Uncharacterized protein n=1 Tax=Ensete ventricosum TaxID=4639 RepID=A0A427AQ62_ENSVE|nr:hypothetical protein B296_00001651 [Ensete ventricosum]